MIVKEMIEKLELMEPFGLVLFEDENGFLRDILSIVEDSDGDTILKETNG